VAFKLILKMKKGFSLIEIILAVAIFALVASFFIFAFIESYKIHEKARDWRMATILAEEGIEAVRSIRDSNYDNIPSNQSYGLIMESEGWKLIKGYQEKINKFNRELMFDSDISSSKGIRVISIVSWRALDGLDQRIELYSLLTNWR